MDLSQLAAEVLKVKAVDKTERHHAVIRLALQEIPFFKKMIEEQGEDLFNQCLNRIKPVQMDKDDVVCEIGNKNS